jgi:hypothetical protein
MRILPSNFLGADADEVEGIPALIRHLHGPFLAGPELAVDVLEQLTGYEGRLMPCGFVIWQLFAHQIRGRTFMMDVEIVSSHSKKMFRLTSSEVRAASKSVTVLKFNHESTCKLLSRREKLNRFPAILYLLWNGTT